MNEPVFTTTNVATGGFGSVKAQFVVNKSGIPPGFVNNPVYTQPLYASNVTISSSAHNVVYIAALNGEVYAYDADNLTAPTKLWYRDETNGSGMQGLKHNCDDNGTFGISKVSPIGILQFAGIISTPVIQINSAANTLVLYVTNLCFDSYLGQSEWWLNAINAQTGANFASPIQIQYTAAEVSSNPYGPQQAFFAANQLQRASLLLVNGTVSGTAYKSVLAGFGTSVAEDGMYAKNYQGWMFAYDANPTDPTYLTLNYNQNSGGYSANALPYITQCQYPPQTSGTPYCNYSGTGNPPDLQDLPNPCGQGGGAWMGARAPAANSSTAGSDVFFTAGNGGFSYCPTCTQVCAGNTGSDWQYFTDFGEAVLSTSMQSVWGTQPGSGSNTQAPFWPTNYFVPRSVPSAVTNPNNCGSSGTNACPYFSILNEQDWDMGDSGTIIFDDDYYDGTGTETRVSMALSATKRGDGYVMLQSNLGQYSNPDGNVSTFAIPASNPTCNPAGNGSCDEPRTLAYWRPFSHNGFLVAWPWSESAESFQWVQPGSGQQYTFQQVSTANNPFTGLSGSPSTGYAAAPLR